MIHWKPNKYADLYYLFILLWILLLMLKTLCCLLFLWKQLGNSDTFFFAYISEYFECYILHSKVPQTEKECGTKTSGESYSYDIIVCLTNYMSDWIVDCVCFLSVPGVSLTKHLSCHFISPECQKQKHLEKSNQRAGGIWETKYSLIWGLFPQFKDFFVAYGFDLSIK